MLPCTSKVLMRTPLILAIVSAWQCVASAGGQTIYGEPGRADVVAQHVGFTVGYRKSHRQAAWVAYDLTREKVETDVAKRGKRNYFQDPSCPHMVMSGDFSRNKCDHGHLASACDMHWDEQAMKESFMFSNMSPQKHKFNQVVWLVLERYIRGFACTEGQVFVITGPVLPQNPNLSTAVGERLTVPVAFYKVVYSEAKKKMIGFLVPHREDLVNPKPFACSVDDVEKATGLDFFSALAPELQRQLESSYDMESWTWIQRDN